LKHEKLPQKPTENHVINENFSEKSSSIANLDIDAIFQAIVDISPIAVLISDLGGKLLYASQQTADQQHVQDPSELLGMNVFSMLAPEEVERAQYFTQKTLEEGIARNIEYQIKRRDGTHFPGELSAALIKNTEGEPAAFIGVVEDISKFKQSEEQFRFLFDNLSIAVCICDLLGNLLVANQTFHKVSGYAEEEIIQINVTDLFMDIGELQRLYHLMKNEGDVKNYPVELKKKGGIRYWGRIDCKIMEYQGKKVVISSVIDISEQKKAEEAMQILLADTRKVSDMKTSIITFATHELKTPLIPIIGWTELIKRALDNGQDLNEVVTAENLDAILRNAERLHQMINDFLDVGQIESARLDLDLEWTDLHEIVEHASRATAYQAETSNIAFHDEISELILFVDQSRIEQVFINLFSNAIKYSPPNTEVWVRAWTDGDNATITVEDQGYGFTAEELEDVMQPFSKSVLRSKSDHVFSGTGVGLYICKGIVERHGGTITITSPGENQGSTVAIILPLKNP